ncbi:hypothetical protein HK101_005839 [Irineochytrium annulatum]|nr:hypothetical protein HK101_005839 [Irineochytrium annulatum]
MLRTQLSRELQHLPRVLPALVPVVAPHLRRTFITIIDQGFEAWRLTLGANPTRLQPGLHLAIPLIQEVHKVDLREGTIPIPPLQTFTRDNVPVHMGGSLFYRVRDGHRACFKIQDMRGSVASLGTSTMRSIIGLFDYDQIIADRHSINQQLRASIGEASDEWGVSCTRFEIQHFTPSNEDVKKVLEQQMEAERRRRTQILDTEANVNVAEGAKRQSILESEGALIALRNASDGDLYRRQKEGDAELYMLRKLAEGFRQQVEELAKSLDGDSKRAADLLIELKRIEQLKAISEGKNNTIYFVEGGNVAGGQKDLASIDVMKRNLTVGN